MDTKMKGLTVIALFIFILSVFFCSRPALQEPGVITPGPILPPSEAKGGWEVEWQKTLAEARKEGRVIVYGPPGSDVRKALTEGFQKAYPGIEVEWTGMMGAATVPKVKAERRAGIFNVDLHIGGTTSIVSELIQFAIPIEPLLILPEVRDTKFWKEGKFDFADKAGKYDLVFAVYGKVAIAYNPTLLDPRKAQEMSYWDLAAPELKGKVIARDPRTAGPGQASFMFLYAHPQLGPDMIKALGKNDVVLNRDERQILEFTSRGRYAVAIGHSDLALTELRKAGIQNIRTQPMLKEGTYTTAGFSSLVVFEPRPHPKAAIAYINWLLSKEGQTAWSTSSSYPSRRIDVPTEHLDPEVLVKPGVNYINTYSEEAIDIKNKLLILLQEVFGR